jgi:hypothetical protein
MKDVKRFGMKGKLTPRYIRPFAILEKCGNVAYKLELPSSLVGVCDIFHISQLKKCLKAPVNVVLPDVTSLEEDLTYPEHPSRSWTKTIVSQGARRSSSARFNGAIISKMKQLGRVNTFSVPAMRTSSYHSKGTCDCSLSLLGPSLSNLESGFIVKGEGCDIPSVIVAISV